MSAEFVEFDEDDAEPSCDVCDGPLESPEAGQIVCDDCTGLAHCVDDICYGLGYCMHYAGAWIP